MFNLTYFSGEFIVSRKEAFRHELSDRRIEEVKTDIRIYFNVINIFFW
ncbi:hypothetical protein wTpre_428 [Wolbachia endosymbiont of Trichogramma pretiosum]|nr:hypothetical protein wTpre_428 [Wolbachia endosymbiont of Trichogramma pretiosum]